jgi:hypothetical protein
MENEKKAPRVIEAIIDYVESYNNPDRVEGNSLPIKSYHLNCYDVSYDFMFKWIIQQTEMDEILEWNKDLKLQNGVLKFSIGDDVIELVAN